MTEAKIVLLGPMGAGKTTAIAAVSDIAPLCTDVANADREQSDKPTTTVALDYGELHLADTQVLRLFGAPGQERFAFLRRSLVINALGAVLLLDNSRPDPLADLDGLLDDVPALLGAGRVVVGVGRRESHPLPTVEDYADRLLERGTLAPVLSVDIRRRADVVMLLETLLQQIESMECPL